MNPDTSRMQRALLGLVAVLACLTSCSKGTPTATPPPAATSGSPPPAANAPSSPDFSAALKQAAASPPAAPAAPPADTPPQTEPEMVTEVASEGVGTKGHGYGGDVITEPVRVYFRVQERVVFEIDIPNALKTFKALDPDNKGPKSHEEFMEKIVKEYSINLPNLPEGARYRYDPESETLFVDRPKR